MISAIRMTTWGISGAPRTPVPAGLSFNAFITEAVFGRNRHRPAENRKLALVLGLGQAIVERLKPFNAVAARDPEIKVLLEDIKLILIEIRSALFLLLGRKP